ncbi:MAG: hypothetical protein MHM6MM_004988 [Cercozoa sp. M6MM]
MDQQRQQRFSFNVSPETERCLKWLSDTLQAAESDPEADETESDIASALKLPGRHVWSRLLEKERNRKQSLANTPLEEAHESATSEWLQRVSCQDDGPLRGLSDLSVRLRADRERLLRIVEQPSQNAGTLTPGSVPEVAFDGTQVMTKVRELLLRAMVEAKTADEMSRVRESAEAVLCEAVKVCVFVGDVPFPLNRSFVEMLVAAKGNMPNVLLRAFGGVVQELASVPGGKLQLPWVNRAMAAISVVAHASKAAVDDRVLAGTSYGRQLLENCQTLALRVQNETCLREIQRAKTYIQIALDTTSEVSTSRSNDDQGMSLSLTQFAAENGVLDFNFHEMQDDDESVGYSAPQCDFNLHSDSEFSFSSSGDMNGD